MQHNHDAFVMIGNHVATVKEIRGSRWYRKSAMMIGDHGYYHGCGQFGTQLGPLYTSSLFYHDLGHCIDFVLSQQGDRALMSTFGFKYSTVNINDVDYDEPTTAQAVHRECRAVAIETKLHLADDSLIDVDFLVNNNAQSLRFLGDYLNIPIEYTPDNYHEVHRRRELYCVDKIYQYIDKIRFDDIEGAWCHLIALFKANRRQLWTTSQQ